MEEKNKRDTVSCPLQGGEGKKTTIGGQALLEGLMMVGPQRTVTALRRQDGRIEVEDLPPVKKSGVARIPIVRGAVGIFRQLILGSKAMMRAAEAIEEDERLAEEGEKRSGPLTACGVAKPSQERESSASAKEGGEKQERPFWTQLVLYASAAVGMVGGIALFVLLPNLIASLLFPADAAAGKVGRGILYNVVEGGLRLVILVGYMWATSLMKEMRRLWQYHGAEHKTIACYEAGLELSVDNVRQQSRFHPRCGTSFLFLIVFVSVVLFSLVGWHGLWLNLVLRLAMVPLLAGLSYETLRWSGTHDQSLLARIIAKPGLWVQRLTTAEPDDAIIEVAIAAMVAVIPEDQRADLW